MKQGQAQFGSLGRRIIVPQHARPSGLCVIEWLEAQHRPSVKSLTIGPVALTVLIPLLGLSCGAAPGSTGRTADGSAGGTGGDGGGGTGGTSGGSGGVAGSAGAAGSG